MPIQIPLYLLNQTGPEWDKFVKQAQKAGFELQDVGNVASEVFDNLVKRKLQESRVAVDGLTDSFEKQERSLRGMVKTANALNITPRGYEMTAYRLSGLVESIGAAAVPLGIVAGAVGTVAASIQELEKRGDPSIRTLNASVEQLGNTWHDALYEIGKSGTVQSVIEGLTWGVDQFGKGVRAIGDSATVAWPMLKEFFYNVTGQFKLMDEATKEFMASSLAADTFKPDLRNPKTFTTSRDAAGKALDDIRIHGERKEEGDKLSLTTNREAIQKQVDEAQQRLSEIKMFGAMGDPKASAAEIEKLHRIAASGAERLLELNKEGIKLSKEAAKIDEERARKADRSNPWRNLKDVKTELEKELAIMKDGTADVELRRHAHERVKALVKETVDMEKREADLQNEQVEIINHQAAAQRKINEELRKKGLHIAAHNQQIREQLALTKEQEAKSVMAKQLGGEGGAEGLNKLMGGIDPKRLRAQIGDNRAKNAEAQLKLRQERELAKYDDSQDPWFSPDDAPRREAFIKKQQRELAREKRKARATGMRDFNRGQVGSDEVQDAQADALKGAIDLGQKAGRIGKQQAERMRDMLNETQRNAELLEETNAQLNQLQKQVRLTQDAQLRAEKRLALGKAAFEN